MDVPVRHALATLCYRLSKVLRDTPAAFRDFGSPDTARTPGKILAHIGDLMDWALALVEGRKEWRDSEPLPWADEIARFYAAIQALDDRIAAHGLGPVTPERLFQGAIADALTHTGQLAMLRRMAGIPMRGENYYVADIAVGRLGPDQTAPRREFD
jgi:hypothetical protein